MTQQIIDTGLVANDGTGESLRNAFTAVNNNFANVWAAGPVDTQVIINSNVVSTNVTNLDLRLAGNGIGTITVESTVVPSIDRVYDLGTPAKQYDSVYAQYYFGNGAFLTGISDSEGSVDKSKFRIRISNKNQDIIETCKKLLDELNIKTGKIDLNKMTEVKSLPINGRGELIKFQKVIGFTHPEKRKKLKMLISV